MKLQPFDLRTASLKTVIFQSGAYFSADIISRAIGFVMVPIYARTLSTSEYGVSTLGFALFSLLSTIYALGLPAAVVRFYHEWRSDEKAVLSTQLWFLTVLIALSSTLLLVLSARWWQQLTKGVISGRFAVIVTLLAAFAASMTLIPLSLLRIQQRIVAFSSVSVMTAAVAATASMVFVIEGKLGGAGVLAGELVASSVALAVLAYLHRSYWGRIWPLKPLGPYIRYSAPLIPQRIAQWALASSDRLILSAFLPMASVGVYGLGYTLAGSVSIVSISLTSAWSPELMKKCAHLEGAELRQVYPLSRRYGSMSTLVVSFCATCVAFSSRDIIAFLAPSDYYEAAAVLALVSIGYLFHSIYLLVVNWLFIDKRTNLIPWTAVVSGFVNIALNILLVPRIGMIAAALNTSLSFLLMAIIGYYLLERDRRHALNMQHILILVFLSVSLTLWGQSLNADSLELQPIMTIVLKTAFVAIVFGCGLLLYGQRRRLKNAMPH